VDDADVGASHGIENVPQSSVIECESLEERMDLDPWNVVPFQTGQIFFDAQIGMNGSESDEAIRRKTFRKGICSFDVSGKICDIQSYRFVDARLIHCC
jgi:hypothetical protein